MSSKVEKIENNVANWRSMYHQKILQRQWKRHIERMSRDLTYRVSERERHP